MKLILTDDDGNVLDNEIVQENDVIVIRKGGSLHFYTG